MVWPAAGRREGTRWITTGWVVSSVQLGAAAGRRQGDQQGGDEGLESLHDVTILGDAFSGS